jgi:hypothetical protein
LPLPFIFFTASLSQLQELLYRGKALYLSTCGKLDDKSGAKVGKVAAYTSVIVLKVN